MHPSRQLTKEDLLFYRVRSLLAYVERHNGKWDDVVALKLYDLLETHQGRSRAIWNYLWLAMTEYYEMKIVANVRWYSRLWWLRYVNRMSDEQILELFEEEEQQANELLFEVARKLEEGGHRNANN